MLYANHYGWSDVNPFEVVRTVSEKTMEIRAMDAERSETWKPEFIPGGFSAHCTNNNDQEWDIKSNENNPIIRIRLGKKGWKDAHGRKFGLSDQPRKHYDFNF